MINVNNFLKAAWIDVTVVSKRLLAASMYLLVASMYHKLEVIIVLLQQEVANITHQTFNNTASLGINRLFIYQMRNHKENIKLFVQRPKRVSLCSSFSHRATILRNNLPQHLKSKPNITSFKICP